MKFRALVRTVIIYIFHHNINYENKALLRITSKSSILYRGFRFRTVIKNIR